MHACIPHVYGMCVACAGRQDRAALGGRTPLYKQKEEAFLKASAEEERPLMTP